MKSTNWYSLSDTDIIREIGKRMRLKRMSENLTQQMLADQAGLNRSTIRDIENGKPVNLLSIIPVFRRLNLLEGIDQSIPDYDNSPVLAITQKIVKSEIIEIKFNKMSQYIEVSLLNKPLGVLAWNREKNEGQFEFQPGFVNNIQEISPINYSKNFLSNNAGVHKFTSLNDVPHFFRDIFPGDFANRLLRYALQKAERHLRAFSPLSIFSLLGNRGIGAFGFEPFGYPELDETESVEIDRMVRSLHQMFQSGSKDISEKRLRELLRCGLFSTGTYPEIFLAINDYNGEVLSGQGKIPAGYDAWKLKFDGLLVSSSLNLKNEYSNYLKAIECGIDMVKHRLLKEGTHTHLLISRIDRVKSERIHFQSFISLRDEQINSFESVFRCMRQLRLQYPEIIQMYKRMVFSVLIGMTCETGKNLFFTCHKKNEWHLAPASEIIPTPWIKNHYLSVCGKTFNITTEDLIKFGELQNIRKCGSIVKKIEDVILS